MADKMEGVVLSNAGIDPSKYPCPIETHVLLTTIYVSNLEERVKIDTLKKALTVVFEHYGTIIDIVAKTSLKRKGQAFVVFDKEKSCIDAIEEMDGFEMYGKAMKVTKAKTHSDKTVEIKAASMLDEHKRKRQMIKDLKRAEEENKAKQDAAATQKPRPKPGVPMIPDEFVPPNATLYLPSVPEDVTRDDLFEIYENYPGFKDVRMPQYGRVRDVAFVEFEHERFSIVAKERTAGMAVGKEGRPLKVVYQRATATVYAANNPYAPYFLYAAHLYASGCVRAAFYY